MKITELQDSRCRAMLTQHELAVSSGVSHDTISKIECGKRTKVHAITAKKLAVALGVEVDELAGPDAGSPVSRKNGEPGSNCNRDAVAKRIELCEIGKDLNDNRLDLVLDLARELAAASCSEEIKK